jgi:hypothetical protein
MEQKIIQYIKDNSKNGDGSDMEQKIIQYIKDNSKNGDGSEVFIFLEAKLTLVDIPKFL